MLMTRNRQVTLVLVLLGAVVLLLLMPRKRRTDWTESYEVSSRAPYGTQALYAALGHQFEYRERVRLRNMEQLMEEAPYDGNATYIYVGYGWSINAEEASILEEFVAAGNHAVIVARHIPQDFMTEIIGWGRCEIPDEGTSYAAWEGTSTKLSLRHPDLDGRATVHWVSDYDTTYTRWQYFQWAEWCRSVEGYVVYGESESSTDDDRRHPNFVGIRHGEGLFIFHTTPLAFTNYYAIQPDNQRYLSEVLAHIPDSDERIYWDEGHRLMGQPRPLMATDDEEAPPPSAGFSEKTPLEYILSQPSLSWAWYVLLATALLYVWFGAKRRQRAIPVRAPRQNTTLAFIETVGLLRWQRKRHGRLMEEQYKLWLYDIQSRYGLVYNIQDLPDAEALQPLAKASGLPLLDLEMIVAAFAECRESAATWDDRDLLRWQRRLEAYYRDRK